MRKHKEDHPRIRGVHPASFAPISKPLGSSPHTRGARVPGRPGVMERRIIPAYAGCTIGPSGSPRGTQDHPRIRGVHA